MLAIPYARFIQMLRVIGQERHYDGAWNAWLAGNRHKNDRTFGEHLQRLHIDRTRPDEGTARADRERELARTRAKLGRLYRPPIKA